MADAFTAGKELEQPAFVLRPVAEIGRDGVGKTLSMIIDQGSQRVETAAAGCQRRHHLLPAGRLDTGESGLQRGCVEDQAGSIGHERSPQFWGWGTAALSPQPPFSV